MKVATCDSVGSPGGFCFAAALAVITFSSQRLLRIPGGSGRLVEPGEIANIVAQVDGFAIDNSPRRLEPMVNALVAINALRKDFNRITDEMFFGFAWLSTGGFFSRLFVGVFVTRFVGVEQFVAYETVIFREDGLLR